MSDSPSDKGDRRVAEATGDFYCEAEQVRGSLKCQRPCDSCWKAFAPSASEATGETPRTDAELAKHGQHELSDAMGWQFARQLERELASMTHRWLLQCNDAEEAHFALTKFKAECNNVCAPNLTRSAATNESDSGSNPCVTG